MMDTFTNWLFSLFGSNSEIQYSELLRATNLPPVLPVHLFTDWLILTISHSRHLPIRPQPALTCARPRPTAWGWRSCPATAWSPGDPSCSCLNSVSRYRHLSLNLNSHSYIRAEVVRSIHSVRWYQSPSLQCPVNSLWSVPRELRTQIAVKLIIKVERRITLLERTWLNVGLRLHL